MDKPWNMSDLVDAMVRLLDWQSWRMQQKEDLRNEAMKQAFLRKQRERRRGLIFGEEEL